jgi:hypothetical protein
MPYPERSWVPLAALNSNAGRDPLAFGFGLPALTVVFGGVRTKFSVRVEAEAVELPLVVVLVVALVDTLLTVMVPLQSGLSV